MSIVESVVCDLCGSDDTREVLRTTDRNWFLWGASLQPLHSPDEFWTVVRCNVCGLSYLNPRPTAQSVMHHYPEQYYAHRSSDQRPQPASWKRFLKRWLRRFKLTYYCGRSISFLDGVVDPVVERIGFVQSGRILEVGCGPGHYLDRLKSLGWETYGVEISSDASSIASQKGHQMLGNDIIDTELPTSHFDVVQLSHVLEHVASPCQALRKLHKSIRPGGVVLVDVPNFGSPICRLLDDCNSNLDVPRHFYHFDIETLSAVLSQAGFHVSSTESSATERFVAWSLALVTMNGKVQDDQLLAEHKHAVAEFFRVYQGDAVKAGLDKAIEMKGWGNQLSVTGVKGT